MKIKKLNCAGFCSFSLQNNKPFSNELPKKGFVFLWEKFIRKTIAYCNHKLPTKISRSSKSKTLRCFWFV